MTRRLDQIGKILDTQEELTRTLRDKAGEPAVTNAINAAKAARRNATPEACEAADAFTAWR